VTLELPDLNLPIFAELSHGAMLRGVDEMAGKDDPWRLIGSSLGGWLAARWAELHPERVERLVLLCPGFDLASRWPVLLGDLGMDGWRGHGYFPFEDAAGQFVLVHYGFYEEALAQPATPEVPCPTLIVHGTRDEVVPIDSSRRYAETRDHVELIEVDDDHKLAASIDRIADEVARFFGV
jgi:pimeloyl-ACP methyl ester carboxylesterase